MAKVVVEAGGLTGEALKEAVDADIAEFDEFFQKEMKNAPLVPSEKAILSTYLYWKTSVKNAGDSSTG